LAAAPCHVAGHEPGGYASGRYLPILVRVFEEGLKGLEFEIVSRSHYVDGDGTTVPVLEARGRELTFRLELRNAIEDFLAVDREAVPVRIDPKLGDPDYAMEKLQSVLRDRLVLVAAIDSEGVDAAALAIISRRFAWVRMVRIGGGESAWTKVAYRARNTSGDLPVCPVWTSLHRHPGGSCVRSSPQPRLAAPTTLQTMTATRAWSGSSRRSATPPTPSSTSA
jgi:hypothetical protein